MEQHLIGLRYTHKSLYAVYPQSLNPELSGQKTVQTLNSAELFGRFYIARPLQLAVQLPVNFITEKTSHSTSTVHGLGDMSLLLQYSLLKPKRCNGKAGKHQLKLGAGVKLPSGQFKMNSSSMFLTSLQLGTGSVDFLFNGVYTYSYKKFGFNLSAAYKLNTANPQQYKFGNRVQSSLNVFYAVTANKLTITPSLSVSYDHAFFNRLKKVKQDYTGGDFLTTAIGLDLYYKHFVFSSSFTPALMNRLIGAAKPARNTLLKQECFTIFQTLLNNQNKHQHYEKGILISFSYS